jgi:hypothetical protein
MTAPSRTASEERFEQYLTEHGYTFEYEPDLGVTTRPDYLIARGGTQAVCKVKEFATTAISDALAGTRGTRFLSDKQVFGAVRARLDAAARQLKPVAARGLPLVAVLANPRGADVSLEPNDVMAAMYGNPAFATSIDPEGVAGEGEFFLHRDGSFTAKGAYVSAVVTLHQRRLAQDWADREIQRFEDPWEFIAWSNAEQAAGRMPDGTRRFVHVFNAEASAEGRAAPLPAELFDGPDDAAWSVVDGAFVQTGGETVCGVPPLSWTPER